MLENFIKFQNYKKNLKFHKFKKKSQNFQKNLK